MGFWKNVDDYLKYKVISRKELAAAIGMKSQTIDRAIQRDSDPKLIEGLKVCKFLNVDPEDFIGVPITVNGNLISDSDEERKKEIKLYRKYHDLIQNCEFISESHQSAV